MKTALHILLMILLASAMFADTSNESHTTTDGLISNQVTSISLTNTAAWIGTDSGVTKISGLQDAQYVYESYDSTDGLATDYVSCISTCSNDIWIGSDSGVTHIDETGQLTIQYYTTTDGLLSCDITALGLHNGFLWVGTDQGLCKIDIVDDVPTNEIREIVVDANSNDFIHNLPSGYITAISFGVLNSQFVAAIGSQSGVYILSGADLNHMDCLQDTDGLISNQVSALAFRNNRLWIGTDAGISILSELGSQYCFQNLTSADGLSSDAVSSLSIYGDRIWVGTDNGLTMIAPETTPVRDFDYVTYLAPNGLNSNTITSLACRNGNLWIGSDAGINVWNVEQTPNDPINFYQHPDAYLEQNFPNPFNPETTIGFSIKSSGNIAITIYNTKGQVVKNLIDSYLQEGTHQVVWNGKDSNGKAVASGVYFYGLNYGSYTNLKKMIMLK
ncbi:MAG: T9SS type A sorting domain-containing protein [Candidatus Cloacimonetes bacterium]|nr:T9SS type A sorting domain-containing protein [Candidatus Cloacimonadota bacterium]